MMLLKIFGTAASATMVTATYLIFNKEKRLELEQVLAQFRVNASWTTHHNTLEPSIKWEEDWDRRQPTTVTEAGDSEEKKKPKASRHILLIRHGQYIFDSNDEKCSLTELGKEQAHLTGERLKALNLPFSRLVMSTMTRATETGKIISSYLPDVLTESCSLLREGAPIPPEPPVGHWRPEAKQFFVDGARIEAAFRKYFYRADVDEEKDSYDVLVCHANVIRYFTCRALQLPPEAWLRMSLHNGSVTWLVVRPSGRVSLRAMGDCGFMPADKLTTT